MSAIRIRRYGEEDHDFVVYLSELTLLELHRMDPEHEPRLVPGKAARWFESGLRASWAQRSLFFVAEIQNEPVGFVIAGPANDGWSRRPWLRRPTRRRGEIYELHVAKRHRRKGVGTALLRAAENELARRGFGEVVLGHLARNTVAARLYAAEGYRPKSVVEIKKLRRRS